MNELKKEILLKSSVVHRQNMFRWISTQESKNTWNEHKRGLEEIYIYRIPKTEGDFFSYNKSLQEEGLKSYKSLLLLRPWEDIDDTFNKNNENKDKFKDRFVDDFNNFSEFYEFLEELVKDVEKYHHMRINNLTDK